MAGVKGKPPAKLYCGAALADGSTCVIAPHETGAHVNDKGETVLAGAPPFKSWEAQGQLQASGQRDIAQVPAPSFSFVQFAGIVSVKDSRGTEELTDRARLGDLLGPHGVKVLSIVLVGQFFEITTEGGAVYCVPIMNIRSARR